MTVIDDLVVLGRACPEPLKDKRVTVCLGGWSAEFGFVRLYPTRMDMKWRNWDIVRVEAEQNPDDTRLESYKIAGSKDEWDILGSKIEIVGHVESRDERRNLIGNLTDTCVQVINSQRRSLGIVKPAEILKTYFEDNPGYGKVWQMGLPGLTELDGVRVKRDFPYEPRIRYRCPECTTSAGYHDQQVLEWGFYQWFLKEPDKRDQVWENARFGRADTDIYLFVGNQFAHRTSFMVISVLRVPTGPVNFPLLPLRKLPD